MEKGDYVLPIPPQQSAAWTPPPTKLPKTLVSTAVHLFQLGLGDPRGCEYREIEPDVYGHGWSWSVPCGPASWQERRGERVPPFKFHGWVLPAAKTQGQRFAICWNGAAYPLVAVGGPADLRSDVLGAVKADEEARIAWAKENSNGHLPFRFVIVRPALNFQNVDVFRCYVHPLVVFLLLRAGQTDLVEKVWDQWARGFDKEDIEPFHDCYACVAGDWTWALFDQLWDAHMAGDDPRALATARFLVKAWGAIEAEAKRRGLRPRREPSEEAGPALYLPELEPARLLLADQQRRLQERQNNTAPAANIHVCGDALHFWESLQRRLQQCPNKAARIAVLIQHLEEACDEVELNGGNMFTKMLVEEGDEAVEPLLKCLESDDRLTRLDFKSIHAQVQHVHMKRADELAFAALQGILQTSFPTRGSPTIDTILQMGAYFPEKDRGVIETIRTYWNLQKGNGSTPPERWYRMLADDAHPNYWLEAAAKIVSERPIIRNGWVMVEPQPLPGATRAHRKMAGEPLRRKTQPSVAELMARRVSALKEQREKRLTDHESDRSATKVYDMSLCLAQWDPKAALPLLKETTAECRRDIAETSIGGERYAAEASELYAYVARLTLVRAAAGDLGALDEYSEWVRGVTPEDVREDQRAIVLEPLWRYAYGFQGWVTSWSDALNNAATRLFQSRQSPWNPIVRIARERVTRPDEDDWMAGPLLTSIAFRKQLAQVLKEKREAGHVDVHAIDRIELTVSEGWTGTAATVPGDPLCPPPGTKTAFRLCDLCAFRLSQIEGAPRCKLYWPEKKRDEAVAACAEFLHNYGDQFRVPNEPFMMSNGKEMTLGVAPCSKWPDNHHVRLAFEAHPVAAVWTALKDYPFVGENHEQAGNGKKTIAYEQRGTVWGAEENKNDDAWRPNFTFVGLHCVGRVRAEEIDFPWDQYPAEPLGPALQGTVVPMLGAHGQPDLAPGVPGVFRLGSPMICKLRVRNHAGRDRPLPPLVEKRPGTVAPAGTFGFQIQIDYTPYNCSGVRVPGLPPPLPECVTWDRLPWKMAPRKDEVPFTTRQPDRPLRPTEEWDVGEFRRQPPI